MSLLALAGEEAPGSCPAARLMTVAQPASPCDGPGQAVRLVDGHALDIHGCVRHIGDLLAHDTANGRVYVGPDGVDGDAIRAYYRGRALAALLTLERRTR